MRFIKKLSLDRKDPEGNRFAVQSDNRIDTNTKVSLKVPAGQNLDRAATPVNGMVRYNSDLSEFEVYNSLNPGLNHWEILRTIRPATITMQQLGQGNYSDTIFGPLSYNISLSTPQNIFVYVDNVYQVPVIDYTLTLNPSSVTAALTTATLSGSKILYLNTLTNIDVGTPGIWRTITGSNIQPSSTITNISLTFDYIRKGYPIGISLPVSGNISAGTTATVSYTTGTFIQFTGPVPSQQVFALLGFDGNFPAGPNGTAWES